MTMSTTKQPTNMSAKKMERCSNFDHDETSKLVNLLRDYPVITCKKTDSSSNKQKEAAWKMLALRFNADSDKYRNVKQLQQKFNNIKKTARKEMATEKYGRRQTGGGPAPPKPSETTEWLNSIMAESISGLPALYDSDAIDDSQKASIEEVIDSQKASIEVDDIVYYDENILDLEKENICNNDDVSPPVILESENTFDTSTPKAMLRKPVSKELVVNNKRKTAYNPQQTRKKIIMHVDKKMELVKQKQAREEVITQYAREEHEKNMLHKDELHQREMNCLLEKHDADLKRLEELHKIEIGFKRQLHDLIIEKNKLQLEKAKLELEKCKLGSVMNDD